MPKTESTQNPAKPDLGIRNYTLVAVKRDFPEPRVLLNATEGITPLPFNPEYFKKKIERKVSTPKK